VAFRARQRWLLAAWLVLAAFGATLTADLFEHTDDGCVVELHCNACRTLHGAAAVPMPALAPSAFLQCAERVVSESATLREADPVRNSEPRAPPLA
jgi:hypothetical protein